MQNNVAVITGATGHIGYALLKQLENTGASIRILIRKDTPIFDGIACEKYYGDITQPETLDEPFHGADTVYHLAGMIDISLSDPLLMRRVNVDGTVNVVEACKRNKVRRLVYASSVDAMPPSLCGCEITEPESFPDDRLEGAYALTKAEATRYVLRNNKAGLETVVALPSACIGPYDYKVSSIGEMVRMFMRDSFHISLSFGAYNFVDVRDVADGMIAMSQQGKAGESYLLTGSVLAADDVFKAVAKKCGVKPPLIKLPLPVAKLLAPEAELYYKLLDKTPLFTRLSIKVITYNCNFSHQKAAKQLGYSPMSAEQSFGDMVDWIEEHEHIMAKRK